MDLDISQHPSPNFNDRREKLDMLVLHYTGMETGQAALDRMRDPAAEVSAHYMVWEDGRVAQLVDEDKRAWHAGVSSWKGQTDLNSRSIGIEIVNGGHDVPLPDGSLPPYPLPQIHALIELCHDIIDRRDIPALRILGHSDIAPGRKIDPGEHFPWERMARAGVGVWPASPVIQNPELNGPGLKSGDKSPTVRRMREHLAEIGYGIEISDDYDADCTAVVTAFQRRWVPDNVTGDADILTLRRIGAVHAAYTA